MPVSYHGTIPYEDVPECVEPPAIPLKPRLQETELSSDETDTYWPLEETDPKWALIVIPDETAHVHEKADTKTEAKETKRPALPGQFEPSVSHPGAVNFPSSLKPKR